MNKTINSPPALILSIVTSISSPHEYGDLNALPSEEISSTTSPPSIERISWYKMSAAEHNSGKGGSFLFLFCFFFFNLCSNLLIFVGCDVDAISSSIPPSISATLPRSSKHNFLCASSSTSDSGKGHVCGIKDLDESVMLVVIGLKVTYCAKFLYWTGIKYFVWRMFFKNLRIHIKEGKCDNMSWESMIKICIPLLGEGQSMNLPSHFFVLLIVSFVVFK